MKYLDKTQILFSDALNATYNFLVEKYRQSRDQLTPSSPYMQVILVLHNISENIYSYIEEQVIEFNILKARKIQSIHGIARLVGHDASRAVSAKGEIQMKIKPEVYGDIIGSYIIMENHKVIKSKNTQLKYTLHLNKDKVIFDLNNSEYVKIPIIQGEYNTQTVISDGTELQSFNIQGSRNKFIDQEYIGVYVNGVYQQKYESLYDIPYNTDGVIIKTGISGGIDIYFGNTNYGKIPDEGSEINIIYLENDGITGNIYQNPDAIEFEWESDLYDNLRNDINVEEIFDVQLTGNVIFGSNPESTSLTRLIAPMVSRTNILGNVDSYIYHFQKMNIFSHVDAYTLRNDDYLDDDNIIYVYLIPDVTRKLETDDYFNIPSTSFLLEDEEKDRIKRQLIASKKQVPGTEVEIVIPKIKRYILNIVLRVFDGYDDTTLRNEIKQKMSDYFLSVRRRDKIPRSDLVRIIEKIKYVDSVFVEFISAENEIAINNGYYMREELTETGSNLIRIEVPENTDPNLGLDDFGDIIINSGELPVIRGNFTDRNNNYYSEYYETNKTGPLNIFVNDIIEKDVYSELLSDKLSQM